MITGESNYVIWRRCFEIIPGAISWFLLLLILFLSIVSPIVSAVFVICFYLFWLLRLLYMTILLVASYAGLHQEQHTNWIERCHDLIAFKDAESRIKQRIAVLEKNVGETYQNERKTYFRRLLRSEHSYLQRLRYLERSHVEGIDFRNIYHAVIFPNYKEDVSILTAALNAIRETNYPLDRFIVVMAFEEREGSAAHDKARELQKQFKGVFFDFLATFHPGNLSGERAVKGANATWSAKHVAEYLDKKKIPFDQVLVSCFDADTCVGKEYFGCLTYNFLIRKDRLHCSFQPIPVYHNNVWEAPAVARMMETSSSYWQLIESANPDHLVTFSSHSMSFQALVAAGYWPVDMISDDSAIFWKCFLHYKGRYRAIPIPTTLSMNIVIGENWLDTFKKLYVQKRRWAWGIENFPMVMIEFMRDKSIPWLDKFRHGFKMLESHVSWATWGLMVGVFGWFPIIFGGREYGLSVVSYNLPKIAQLIFNLAWVSLLVSAILSLLITPKPPTHVSKWKNWGFVLQWPFLPLVLPILVAMPALDAQTRLLLGRYLHFEVSKKV